MGLPKKEGYPFIRVKMMELYIETLTGTAFELRVSPYETVQDVKARIQHLEGIPISQQHLVWQSVELEDDFCLRDYSITDGATLKLVLTLRGGPINTRRIPFEDQALHEMAEYLYESGYLVYESSEKLQATGPVTVIVYHNGDQLNFYRVVDADSTSPLSESLRGAYLYEDEEDEDDDQQSPPVQEKGLDEDKTREKMKLLRTKMENMTVSKKPKKKLVPRPPSSHRPSSHLRRFASNSGRLSLLNRNPCLPPVSHSASTSGGDDAARLSLSSPPRVPAVLSHQLVLDSSLRPAAAAAAAVGGQDGGQDGDPCVDCPSPVPIDGPASFTASVLTDLHSPADAEPLSPLSPLSSPHLDGGGAGKAHSPQADMLESLWQRSREPARLARKWDPVGYTETQLSLLRSLNSRLPPATGVSALPPPIGPTGAPKPRQQLGAGELSSHDALQNNRSAPLIRNLSSTKFASGRNMKKPSVILESLDPSEVQAMSGVLTSIVQSANKSRGFTVERSMKDNGRLTSTGGRLLSSHLQKLPTTRDGLIMSPGHHLPPVKQKKKSSKRCFMCAKKTGLATSYPCRCGNNYCALHRYAECHECTFDYKTEGRKILAQSNPVITAPKLPKI